MELLDFDNNTMKSLYLGFMGIIPLGPEYCDCNVVYVMKSQYLGFICIMPIHDQLVVLVCLCKRVLFSCIFIPYHL